MRPNKPLSTKTFISLTKNAPPQYLTHNKRKIEVKRPLNQLINQPANQQNKLTINIGIKRGVTFNRVRLPCGNTLGVERQWLAYRSP